MNNMVFILIILLCQYASLAFVHMYTLNEQMTCDFLLFIFSPTNSMRIGFIKECKKKLTICYFAKGEGAIGNS